ncbi:hypothetical protein HN51_068071 [Arachis hypogaea]|uniref:putative disease resistance RPP13-like protein 3 n=1 Tax=Arachis hypogaea TaxID=3818 RepID=UPI000DEC519D|nr:putative disease resistance RPP13-like protein 3 [Arachis hypogaea]XP_025697066.1 putative disease resistance RPP13-like protein 3 [Arachis hypogaea]
MADDGAAGVASSSLPAPWLWATSSLSSEGGMYDVFLNFRGEDTRFLFTDYLYHGLADVKKLQVFRDDPGLELGDAIKPTLMEAIKRSRIHIVVMSENYVSSSWCLLELEQMLKYSNNGTKRPVFPVFYRVKPAEVRYQISTKSKEAMKKHEARENKEKADAWKLALSTVCGLSGEHIVEKGDHYETAVVGKIAEQVSAKLLEIRQQLNRFDSQFGVVESLLNLESCDTVGVVGIYEDPKIGKSYITTFAFELYYKIKYKFQTAAFLVDVSTLLRKTTDDNRVEIFRQELLSDMVGKKMHELKHEKMLLVLEGVDSKEHLELLVGMRMGIGDWFGGGSRIMIATENRNLFEDCPAVMNGVKVEKHCIREGEFGKEKIVKEKKVVGFVKEFIDVINQLKEEDPKGRNVVSIVGMGGSGKTTLAKKIYDSNEVSEVFSFRAWVTVSKDYTEKEIFSTLFRSLKPSKPIPEEEGKLKKEVRSCFTKLNEESTKYLVVLDDVWDTQLCHNLKDYLLPNNNNGSRILVTTRNHEVANRARSKEPHSKLLRLNEEESWRLFCNEVFCGEDCPPDLEPIGKSIVESCKGLPLAIITIAGVVAKKEEEEWGDIEKLIPHWDVDDDIIRMKNILKTSYDDLHENLKPCFLYLGVFPEDYNINVTELIRLWMAEGFIQVRETGTSKAPPQPEDVGRKYLKDLVDRNLVQVTKRKSDGKGVKTCQIHDLFRDLCIEQSNAQSIRRLSFTRKGKYYACSVICNQSSICSLFVYGIDVDWSSDTPENLQSINVLHFETVGGKDPRVNFKELIHLKYLRIYKPVVPIRIGEYKELMHLNCRGGVKLQADREGPNNILQNLQSLSYVRPDSVLESLIKNGCFPNLNTLGLLLYSEDKQGGRTEVLKKLGDLRNLRNLKLHFDHMMKYYNTPALLMDEMEFLSNLTKITLEGAWGFNSSDMAALGRIANLKTLKLNGGLVSPNRLISCGDAGSFPKLEMFHMIDMYFLQCLALEEGVMPCLQRVVISHCGDLREIPERLLSLSNLRHLHDDIWEEADNASNKYELRRTSTSS